MLNRLKAEVYRANLSLLDNGLIILGEGNVSAIAADRKHVVIKPSGVECRKVKPEDMVVVDLEGRRIEGELNPSVDTWTHLEIYRGFRHIKAIVHTHSLHATVFAQRRETIPCLGTTHADAFCGDIPVARDLTDAEIAGEYERNTGKAINEVLNADIPAVLVPCHGPFVFGGSVEDAVNNAIVLEKVARMALYTGSREPINPVLLEKHYRRKHGTDRYYGQR